MPQRSKTDGIGIMISLVIAREFGCTFGLKEEELKEALKSCNEKRKKIHCRNTKAAIELCRSSEKNYKVESTLNNFEYGKQREGY